MKTKFMLTCFLLSTVLLAAAGSTEKKDSLGLPGDNLDLYAVLQLFKTSKNLEAFEKALNTESNHVNNLDLNEDKKIDYLRVVDHSDSTVHAIILQVPYSATESQDVAVIEIESSGSKKASLQIVGDEALYGKNYIIEPYEKGDDKSPNEEQIFLVVNVWSWPSVSYIYDPYYTIWISPWGWNYYPFWWYSWQPVMWNVYWGYTSSYHVHYYHQVNVYRQETAHRTYQKNRVTSTTVATKYAPAHKQYEARQKAKKDVKIQPEKTDLEKQKEKKQVEKKQIEKKQIEKKVEPKKEEKKKVEPKKEEKKKVEPKKEEKKKVEPKKEEKKKVEPKKEEKKKVEPKKEEKKKVEPKKEEKKKVEPKKEEKKKVEPKKEEKKKVEPKKEEKKKVEPKKEEKKKVEPKKEEKKKVEPKKEEKKKVEPKKEEKKKVEPKKEEKKKTEPKKTEKKQPKN